LVTAPHALLAAINKRTASVLVHLFLSLFVYIFVLSFGGAPEKTRVAPLSRVVNRDER
jgi:hypothetical protein